jgi:hypothetical protein
MLAEATEAITKKGTRIEESEVSGLKYDIAIKAIGTGTYVAVAKSALDTVILRELIGKVLVYSNPLPSALNKARGISRVKIAPIDVAIRIVDILRNPKLEINKEITRVSRTGRAKKKAVAGLLEATFRSFKM